MTHSYFRSIAPVSTWLFLFGRLTLAFSALGFSIHAADPFAEHVRSSEPLSPAEQSRTFKLPPGFEMQLVASEPDINKPLNMAFDTLGRLWVTTSREYPFPAALDKPGRDRVMIFEDFGPDGRARKVTQFAGGLNIPIGIYPFLSPDAAGKGTWKAVVWSIPNIWLFEDTDGDGESDRREVLYGPFDYTRDTHGNQASFRRGFDGWLYATHGFNNHSRVRGRDGNEVDMQSGNTYRIRLDGARIEQHTRGQVNPFGMAWDPDGNLYSSDCHSLPIYQLLAGGIYPSFGKPHDGLGFAPELMRHSHESTAIDGALYYADDLWPASFQNNIFIGNVMTSRVNRDRLDLRGSTPKAVELDDFVKTEDPWFRPVDNILGPDGAFYIADFYNRIIGHYEVPLTHPGRDRERGRIWRVVYTGKPLRPVALANSLDGLMDEMASPNLTRRLLAMNAVEDRFGPTAVPSILQSLTTPKNESQAIAALWLSWRLGADTWPQELDRAVQSPARSIRVHALRIVQSELNRLSRVTKEWPTGLADQTPEVRRLMDLAFKGLSDEDALVRRCAAESLGTWTVAEGIRPLLDLLESTSKDDTHLRYVLRKSIRDHLTRDVLFANVLTQTWRRQDLLALADVALAVPSESAGAFFLRNQAAMNTDKALLGKALQHAARHAPPEALDALPGALNDESLGALAFQMDLFKAVQQGLDQRGVRPSPVLRDWGQQLAARTLTSSRGSTWSNTPLESAKDKRNPWSFQDRPQADGGPTRVLSSFPNGEQLTGTLRSPEFILPAQVSLFVGGHDGFPDQPAQGKNHVRLYLNDGTLAAQARPPRHDTAHKTTWDLSAYAGRSGYLEVTDGDDAAAYAWLAFGRIEPPVLVLPETDPAAANRRLANALEIFDRLGFPEQDVLGRPPSDWITQVERLAVGQGDQEVRIAALRVLIPRLNLDQTRESLVPLLENGEEQQVIREAAGSSLASVHPVLVATAMKTAPRQINETWARALAASPAGAEALLEAVAAHQTSPQILQSRAVRDRLMATKLPDIEARLGQLTQNLPPTNEAVERLLAQRRAAYGSTAADPKQGRVLFDQVCAVCHQIDGQGGLIGPQLDGIGNRGLDRLIEDLVDPNRNVDHAFRVTVVTLKAGSVITGLLRRQEGEQIVLAETSGTEVSVATREIASQRESDTSLMPENLGEIFSPEDFNHLMAFLLSKRGH